MKHELWYSVVVRDRHGKVVSRERRKSRSFLKAWNQSIFTQFRNGGISVTDITGTPHMTNPGYSLEMDGGGGNTNEGVVVGTGDTPVAIDDYALEALIAHGTGVGEMSYPACSIGSPVVAAPSCYFKVSRSIVNNSPAEITVREAAIYMRMSYLPAYYCCPARDVFSVPQAVPVSGAITVNYYIQVTV